MIQSTKYAATVEVKLASGKVIKKDDIVTIQGVTEDGVGVYMGESSIGSIVRIPFNVFDIAFAAK
jgi:hypothetical protein